MKNVFHGRTLTEIEDAAWIGGWFRFRNLLLASLKNYPNDDGDVEIMEEVERIEREAVARGCSAMDMPPD